MLIDPKDAEIARLNRKIELLRVYQDIVWEPPVGYWQDRAEKAEAERDKVVSEAKGISDHVLAFAKVDTDNPVEAASRMAQHIRELTAERDAALAQVAALREVVKFHERLTVDPSTLSRRDAQMRAEGMRMAADLFPDDLPMVAMLLTGVRKTILAAAEKEAPHG